MRRFTRRQILYLILIIIVIILLLPIKIPWRFKVTAVIYPLQEWCFKRGQDDSYISELRNYKSDVIDQIKSYKFIRGDISEVKLIAGLQEGSMVMSHDTIARIHSFYMLNELTRKRNELHVELKNLDLVSAGKKQAVIDESKQELRKANQEFDLEKKRYLRQQQLFSDSIISAEKFEEAENAYQLALTNIEIARQQVLTVQSGEKTEYVQVIKQRIESLRREIEVLEELQLQYSILAPIDGTVSFDQQENEIVSISDTSGFILKIPVELKDLPYLKQIQSIRFNGAGLAEDLEAEFISVETNVKFLDNRQMTVAKA